MLKKYILIRCHLATQLSSGLIKAIMLTNEKEKPMTNKVQTTNCEKNNFNYGYPSKLLLVQS